MLYRKLFTVALCSLPLWLTACKAAPPEEQSALVSPPTSAHKDSSPCAPTATQFSAQRAWNHLTAQVALGPRPSGSSAALKTRQWLSKQLQSYGLPVTAQNFTASTPLGSVAMANICSQVNAGPGSPIKQNILVGAHYDSKLFREGHFVGANDGASGTAVVLELARVFSKKPLHRNLSIVFFDGEEALVNWEPGDCLYGSTYYVKQLKHTAEQPAAALIIDMVGDKNLRMTYDRFSHPQLMQRLFAAGRDLGFHETFPAENVHDVSDDHQPFLAANIPACDMIGFALTEQGVYPDYWHTDEDTLDKVSAESLYKAGTTAELFLRRLDQELQ